MDENNTNTENMIPQSRLNAVIEQRNEARDQLTAAQQQVQSLQARVTELESVQTELEAAQADLEAAQNAVTQAGTERQIVAAAARMGFADPEDALRLVDHASEDLDASLAALAESKPYLLKQAATPAVNPTNPATGPELTLDAVKKMSPEEINARWDDIAGIVRRDVN